MEVPRTTVNTKEHKRSFQMNEEKSENIYMKQGIIQDDSLTLLFFQYNTRQDKRGHEEENQTATNFFGI